MRLISYHKGNTISRIQAKTGFSFEIADDVHETIPPSDDEITLLRKEIDPLSIRRLELLSGGKRRDLLLEIIIQEKREIQSQ